MRTLIPSSTRDKKRIIWPTTWQCSSLIITFCFHSGDLTSPKLTGLFVSFSLQKQDLPKPLVPDLRQSITRYLDGLHAILPSAQYEQTKKTAEDFLDANNGDGHVLQQDLEAFAMESENWVSLKLPWFRFSSQCFQQKKQWVRHRPPGVERECEKELSSIRFCSTLFYFYEDSCNRWTCPSFKRLIFDSDQAYLCGGE